MYNVFCVNGIYGANQSVLYTLFTYVRRNKINISDTIPSKNYCEMITVSFQSSILTSKAKEQAQFC